MYSRRNYFINKKFQLEIIFAFLFITFLIFFMTIFNIYLITTHISADILADSEYMQFHVILGKITSILKVKIFALVFLDLLVILFIVLFISHQIAGPGYKINMSIQKIKDGNLNFSVNLRENDKFDEIAYNLNLLIDEYYSLISSMKSNVSAMEKHLKKNTSDDIKREIYSLKEKLDKFNL